MQHKFEMGQQVMTPGVQAVLDPFGPIGAMLIMGALIGKHGQLEQGLLDDEDQETNRQSLKHGARIFSAFEIPEHPEEKTGPTKVWVITEADRSSTCILLPEEY